MTAPTRSDGQQASPASKHSTAQEPAPAGHDGIRAKMLTRAKSGSRAAAIRLKCIDCCCGSAAEVRRCALTDCTLHPFRMGAYRREQEDLPR